MATLKIPVSACFREPDARHRTCVVALPSSVEVADESALMGFLPFGTRICERGTCRRDQDWSLAERVAPPRNAAHADRDQVERRRTRVADQAPATG